MTYPVLVYVANLKCKQFFFINCVLTIHSLLGAQETLCVTSGVRAPPMAAAAKCHLTIHYPFFADGCAGSFVCEKGCECPSDGSSCQISSACEPRTMSCLNGLVLAIHEDDTTEYVWCIFEARL